MMLHRCLALLSTFPLLAFASDSLPPAVQQVEKQGVEIIKEVKSEGGLRSWIGKYQGVGVNVWLTPDGKHAISGYMYDEKGDNLSEALFKQELYIPQGRQLWEKLTSAKSIKEGNPSAPRKIVVFADPFCPYCKQFWATAQPWVTSGKVELYTLLVAVINPKSGPYASAILNADDPTKAWREYELSNGQKIPTVADTSKETFSMLQYNQQLMDEMGAAATPAIYYMNDNRELQQVVGMPDEKQLEAMLGPK